MEIGPGWLCQPASSPLRSRAAGDRNEFTSPPAAKLLARYFGGSPTRLPRVLADWRRQARDEAFTIRRDGHQLVVESIPGRRFPLMLREERLLATPLTAREWDVMRSVEAGMTNHEIAALLCASSATVKKHLEHVFHKLGVRSRTAALAQLRPWRSRHRCVASARGRALAAASRHPGAARHAVREVRVFEERLPVRML